MRIKTGSRNSFLAVSVLMALPVFAVGETGASSQQADSQKNTGASYSYAIPAGGLNGALVLFSQQSGGLQFVASSQLTEGRTTDGINGRYTVQEALGQILSGTGMGYQFYSANSFTLVPLDSQTNMLGAVRVDGAATQVVGGGNGSTDVTATEGSGSYSAPALSIGSKSAQAIKDTPQAVSVLSNEQMKDQGISDMTSAMDKMAGVSLVQGSRSDKVDFYSRGRAISRVQIDGGAPMSINDSDSLFSPTFDMAFYDHVELLRGADGLFNGNGNASGVVNLVRKRPLDHSQVTLQSSVGSWDYYRNMVDVTGPLALDGAVRGRAVVTWEKRKFFYDGAKSEKKILFANIEADLTPDTQWRVGGSYTDNPTTPWSSGLFRYSDGRDLNLPRNFSMVMPWSYVNIKNLEWFTQLDHHFSDNWSGNLNFTRISQRGNTLMPRFSGVVDNAGNGIAVDASEDTSKSQQVLFDGTLNGKFDLWDLPQELTLGGNYKKLNASSIQSATANYNELDAAGNPILDSFGFPVPKTFNIFRFRPSDWERPDFTGGHFSPSSYRERQGGVYAKFTFTPWEPLHFMTGVRYNWYKSTSILENIRPISNNEKEYQKPYYAVSYDISPSLSAYASYTSINESQAELVTKDGRPLSPVTGSNKEAGLKYGDDKRNVTLSLYRLTQTNMPTTTSFNFLDLASGYTCCYINNKDTQISEGIDVEYTGEVSEGWQLSTSYTYSRTKYKGENSGGADGTPLKTEVPSQSFKLWTSYQLSGTGNAYLDRLRVGGGAKIQTRTYTSGEAYPYDDSGFTGEPIPFEFTQGFYTVVSAFTSYQIDENWSAALNVNNIFDRRYYQTVGGSNGGNWYGEPRNFMLSVRGQF